MISSVHSSAWYVCLPILPWKPGPVHNSFNAGGFKPRWQPWRTFLVSICVFLPFSSVPYPCWFRLRCLLQENRRPKIYISFIFIQILLAMISSWKVSGNVYTQSSHNQANISGRTNLWPLEIMSWTSDKHIYIYEPRPWKYIFKPDIQGFSFSPYAGRP